MEIGTRMPCIRLANGWLFRPRSSHPLAALLPTPMTPMYGPAVPALSGAVPETQRGLTTMLSHNPPPFHAEHIGSLLRPSKLLDQRAKFARGEIDRTELTKAEDEAIKTRSAPLAVDTSRSTRRRSPSSAIPKSGNGCTRAATTGAPSSTTTAP